MRIFCNWALLVLSALVFKGQMTLVGCIAVVCPTCPRRKAWFWKSTQFNKRCEILLFFWRLLLNVKQKNKKASFFMLIYTLLPSLKIISELRQAVYKQNSKLVHHDALAAVAYYCLWGSDGKHVDWRRKLLSRVIVKQSLWQIGGKALLTCTNTNRWPGWHELLPWVNKQAWMLTL